MKEGVAKEGVVFVWPGPGSVRSSDGPPWATTAHWMPEGLFKPLLVITSPRLETTSATRAVTFDRQHLTKR